MAEKKEQLLGDFVSYTSSLCHKIKLVYKFNEKSTAMFEKVNPPLKCHSNFFWGHIYTHTHTYIM